MTKNIKKNLISLLAVGMFSAVLLGVPMPTEKALADNASVITLMQKAACRVKPDEGDGLANSGLRFTAELEKNAYNELKANYDNVEAGMIIVPEDYVEAAGGCTLENLSGLNVLEGKMFYTMAEAFSENETHYTFKTSIITIKPSNYNRNFTAVSFIKITEDDSEKVATLTNYDEYEGAYYLYSNTHTANVYQIAYAAYEDRVTEATDGYFETVEGSGVYGTLSKAQYDILERYLDSVAVLSGEDGNVNIANNGGTYYESPYQLIKTTNGDAYLSSKPTGLIYNGERYKELSVVDDVNNITVYNNMVS